MTISLPKTYTYTLCISFTPFLWLICAVCPFVQLMDSKASRSALVYYHSLISTALPSVMCLCVVLQPAAVHSR
ncbi:hypothetical protein FIBSPDRAFT_230211 [Athelia psychrophila]|uniref:Uncharacterized protein n=1 Tax=Athelia psychrophila TaxID=1759441 RepID=A0A165YPZ1_9AGAM|nr:hypothetical protein FIBSPDRAFT_230211 [Fibularhizoctonia sp. CBS 109695]